MNNNSSDLMSYCSWSKKNFRYKESIGESFCGFTLYNREHFVFKEPIGDVLSQYYKLKFWNNIFHAHIKVWFHIMFSIHFKKQNKKKKYKKYPSYCLLVKYKKYSLILHHRKHFTLTTSLMAQSCDLTTFSNLNLRSSTNAKLRNEAKAL